MFVKAQSKQRFGEPREPFVNVEQIVSAELGHDNNVNVRLTNNEELTVSGERARKLWEYLQGKELK